MTMERWDDAERHFRDALEMNARMAAAMFLARAKFNYATMLLARHDAGDAEAAERLLSEAAASGEQLEMQRLLDEVEALRSRVPAAR